MKKSFSFRLLFRQILHYSKNILGILFILSILALLFSPLYLWGNVSVGIKVELIEYYKLGGSILLSIVAVILYLRKDKDNAHDYLIQEIEVFNLVDYQKIRTSVHNMTPFDRTIDAAFLIITKQGTDIISEINNNLKTDFEHTNSLIELKNVNTQIKIDFAFIQLHYYSKENIHVGNEKLTFEIALDHHQEYNKDDSGLNFYDVRFFVFRPKTDTNVYHRNVSAVFGIPNRIQDSFSGYNRNLNKIH